VSPAQSGVGLMRGQGYAPSPEKNKKFSFLFCGIWASWCGEIALI